MSQRRNQILAAVLMIGFVAVFLYSNKLDNQFAYDDFVFVLDSPEHDSIANIPSYFFTDQHRLYRPLRSVAYAVVRHFWGFSPVAHSAVGLICHAIMAIVFFGLVYVLSNRIRLAFLAGMILAVHPVAAQRPVFITGSFDMFGMIFAYSGMIAMILYLKNGARHWFSAGLLLFLLGLLGSEEAAMVPLFLTMFAMALPNELEGKNKRAVWIIAVSFVMLFIYLAIRAKVIPGFSRVEQYVAGGFYETMLTMMVVFWRYVGIALAPYGLAAEHGVTIYDSMSSIPVLLAIAGHAAAISIAFFFRKIRPLIFIGIGWFYLGLGPFSNVVPLQTMYAEHYFYCGFMGIALLMALALDAVIIKSPSGIIRLAVLAMIGALFANYFVLTLNKIDTWRTEETLWKDSIEKEPYTYIGNLNWGNVLKKHGDDEGACEHYRKAILYRSCGFEAYVGLGNCDLFAGKFDRAIEHYKQALVCRKGHTPAMEGLSQAYMLSGDTAQAYNVGRQVLEYNPNSVVSLNVVGYILARDNRCKEAMPYLIRLVKLAKDPATSSSGKANLNYCTKLLKAENE